jgi:hypothetical protein
MTPEQRRDLFRARLAARQASQPGVTPRTDSEWLVARWLPCAHRGEPTGETARCLVGCGQSRRPIYGCALHGTCTLGKTDLGRACVDCPEREE